MAVELCDLQEGSRRWLSSLLLPRHEYGNALWLHQPMAERRSYASVYHETCGHKRPDLGGRPALGGSPAGHSFQISQLQQKAVLTPEAGSGNDSGLRFCNGDVLTTLQRGVHYCHVPALNCV